MIRRRALSGTDISRPPPELRVPVSFTVWPEGCAPEDAYPLDVTIDRHGVELRDPEHGATKVRVGWADLWRLGGIQRLIEEEMRFYEDETGKVLRMPNSGEEKP